MKKDYYDYGMALRYRKAKRANDISAMSAIQKEVYDQYLNLTHKMKWDLIKRLQKTYLSSENIYELTKNYEYDIYPTLVHAMDSIKVTKIPKRVDKHGKRTWKFYAALWGYLMVYNRDFTKGVINRGKNEISLDNFATSDDNQNSLSISNKAALYDETLHSKSPENIYDEMIDKKAFWTAVNNCLAKKFNKTQIKLWNMRSKIVEGEKMTISSICNKIHITPKEYKIEMTNLKNIFKNELNHCLATIN